VEPTEILSAGMIARPLAGTVESGLLSPRARRLGIRHAWALGAGAYEVTADAVTRTPGDSQPAAWPRPVSISPIDSGINWSLRLVTVHPGVLYVMDAPGIATQARIRERPPGKQGRIFPGLASAGTRIGGVGGTPVVSAGFHAVHLPDDAGNLEVELLLSHPPMEFVTGSPGQ
jgi:hypothetical protein